MEREKRRQRVASSASRVSKNTLINFAAKVSELSPLFLSSGLHLNWLMSIAVSLIAVIVIFYFNLTSKNAVICLYIALLGQILKSMKNTIDSVFIAYEKMIYIFITTIINKVLYVAFLVLAIYYDTGIIGLFSSIAIANGAAFIFTLTVSSIKFAKPQWNINFRQIKNLPEQCACLAFSGAAARY
ncbi:MAG: oligosaccharide flippase family protein [Nitrospirae bacterium]|nr:oligosaccharide flippase family protein [Nitrospirota bacterium]